ncbi:hypothetical protein L484_025570 [Morus notabilis]|uniref:Uncharacterized protein n=1 Tax=Morus notabilis TaxID=981085 RepID=W9R8M2_9ROSA|nr:hypothetical protein L484_025570 [Morus notabilis]
MENDTPQLHRRAHLKGWQVPYITPQSKPQNLALNASKSAPEAVNQHVAYLSPKLPITRRNTNETPPQALFDK